MDKNKLAKLKEINYTLLDVCALCEFSDFCNYDWGTCSIHKYFHVKHKEEREMSIHKSGNCGSFKRKENMLVGHFEGFIKKKEKIVSSAQLDMMDHHGIER